MIGVATFPGMYSSTKKIEHHASRHTQRATRSKQRNPSPGKLIVYGSLNHWKCTGMRLYMQS